MKAVNIITLLMVASVGCVQEIDVDVSSFANNLVVDGMLTDKPGPYKIRLAQSNDFFEINEQKEGFDQIKDMVRNAEVTVEDDQGNTEIFSEIAPGVYESTGERITGTVGSTYTLKIKLENGRMYESKAETMRPNVGIKEFDKQQVTKTILNDLDNEISIDGFQMTLTPNDFDGIDEFYRWRWEGTYQIETFPHLRTIQAEAYSDATRTPIDPIVPEPDPVPCSGYITIWRPQMGELGGPPITPLKIIKEIGPCECCTCWVTEAVEESVISTTSVGATKVHFDFFENNNRRFGQKYHVKLQQLSLSKEAHNFWKIVEEQQKSGSLFSASNTPLPTNIRSLDDENERVLGYFLVTSVAEVSVYLDDLKISTPPILIDSIKGDCRDLKNSTNRRPFFW